MAFIQLKTTGECNFTISEQIFDIKFPSHYFRRLKTVALSIPSLARPFTALNNTLTLLKSTNRTGPALSNSAYSHRNNDIRFRDIFSNSQSIVVFAAQEGAGVFNVSFQDERYLPFERAGVISTWKLQFPPLDFCAFDIGAIPDVMIHFKYTAREAGEPLSTKAVAELRKETLDAISRAEGQLVWLEYPVVSAKSRMRSTNSSTRAVLFKKLNCRLDERDFSVLLVVRKDSRS